MNHSVLFVDDDPELLSFLREATSGWPYDLYFAKSAKEGSQLIQQHDIHVAVVDQKMPEKSGVELLQEIKSESPGTIRVMMTGYVDLQAVVDAINQGSIFRFIKKPFKIDHFKEVIDNACEEFRRKRGRDLLLDRLEELRGAPESGYDIESDDVAYITLTELNGRLLYWNDAAEEILFRKTDNPEEKSLEELLPGVDYSRFIQQVGEGLKHHNVARTRIPINFSGESQLFDVFVFRTFRENSSEVTLLLAPNFFLSETEVSLYHYVRELEDSAQIKDRGLQFLYEMSVKIGATKSFDELVNTIFSDLKEIIPFDVGMLATVNEQDVKVYIRSEYALDESNTTRLQHEIQSYHLSETDRPLHVKSLQMQIRNWNGNKFSESDRHIKAPLETSLSLPLHSPDNEFIGVIFIGSIEEMSLGGEVIRLFSTFVARVALVLHIIKNILLFKQVREMAIKDSLTGLYNRRFFEEQIDKEIERARRYENALSFLLLDIDLFKNVNDKYGHLNGDIVLESIARLIRESTRNIDISIRYGGEEFVIILPETPQDGALVIAERLRSKIEHNTFIITDQSGKEQIELDLTASIGLTCLDNSNRVSAEKLVSQADQALYYAKSHGRNLVISYDSIAKETV